MTRAASFAYIETSLTPGVTIAQYRAARPARRTKASRVIDRIRRVRGS